jgi:hypothetical protein
MDGWDVRRHRHALIRFDGRTWRVTGKTAFASDKVHYELAAWDPGDREPVGPTIDYSPAYVAARDRALVAQRRRQQTRLWLTTISPFTGFLSARVKGWLEERYGLDPVATTWNSIVIEYVVAIASTAATAIGLNSGGFSVLPFAIAAIASTTDAIVRWDRLLWEERPPPGFFEWIVKRKRSPWDQ